jgi:hypothetical protein
VGHVLGSKVMKKGVLMLHISGTGLSFNGSEERGWKSGRKLQW